MNRLHWSSIFYFLNVYISTTDLGFFALLNQEMASVSLHQVRVFCEVDLKKIRSFDKIDYIFVALSVDFCQHISP